jgi:NADH-quinone oxidoreductase subunit C
VAEERAVPMKSPPEVFDRIRARLGAGEEEIAVSHGILVANLAPSAVAGAAALLRDEFSFDMFLDVTAVDWPGREPRFDVVWHFYSTTHKVRVRVKTRVPESNPSVASLTGLYGSAAFMERECHDMYGIGFDGNADLRPILLYEGFVGHPLRKDYPKEREQPLVPYREGSGERN